MLFGICGYFWLKYPKQVFCFILVGLHHQGLAASLLCFLSFLAADLIYSLTLNYAYKIRVLFGVIDWFKLPTLVILFN